MVNYTDDKALDWKEVKKDRIDWIIRSLKNAIERLPKSKWNTFREEKVKELEKEREKY